MKTDKMNFDLQQYLNEKRAVLNQYLKTILQQFDQSRELIRAMDYSLMAGGKRVRPILSMAAAQACGRDFLYALPVCCAIEMIHTYSLIHDDLPAMDNDDLRRGKPTSHKKFSHATAILTGDALLTHAFHIISEPENIFEKFPDYKTRIKLISVISQAAGTQGMIEGQMMDIQSSKPEPEDSLQHLRQIHTLKTGKMINVSVQAGALSVGADIKTIDSLLIYADKIGLAFQVADDILNIEGDSKIMGKASGSDALNEKMTFPSVIGLDDSKRYAEKLIKDALDSLSLFDESANPLREIAKYIINRDH